MTKQQHEQIESAAYRSAILTGLDGASAEHLAHLADRAILAAVVITDEFKRRFPDEHAAWDRLGADQ